jgi:hypothetical protein
MVAQVDEQDSAMVALAVDPAGQPDGRADVGGAKLGAAMSAVGVHGYFFLRHPGESRDLSEQLRALST